MQVSNPASPTKNAQSMTSNSRVYNVTRRFTLKWKQAQKAVDNRACAWVEVGKTIRDLTLAESIALRIEDAKLSEPLAHAEIPGLTTKWSTLQQQTLARQGYGLLRQANEFAHACNG